MTPTTPKSGYVLPVTVLLLFVTTVSLYGALIALTWTRADLVVEPTVVKTFMTAVFLVPIAMAALVMALFEKWVRANKKIVALGGKP